MSKRYWVPLEIELEEDEDVIGKMEPVKFYNYIMNKCVSVLDLGNDKIKILTYRWNSDKFLVVSLMFIEEDV